MRELVVISGKGGTGKTSLVAAFASLARNVVLCDADVDAADLHLLMSPKRIARHDFQAGNEAVVDGSKCTGCGVCRELCRFDAIGPDYVVDPLACEGCGVCVHFCPEKAIDFPVKTCGEWYISETRFGPMVHARLGVAEENSGKLVTLVRQEARKLAEAQSRDLILTDGPPGIGCPVIASIGGTDAALIVTEPTVSGRHDMERVAQLAQFFRVPVMVCMNKSDLNPEFTQEIRRYAEERAFAFVGAIPFDPIFTRAMVLGLTVMEFDGLSNAVQEIRRIWERVEENLRTRPGKKNV
jgi:MinD superfamily P-loop ATPase